MGTPPFQDKRIDGQRLGSTLSFEGLNEGIPIPQMTKTGHAPFPSCSRKGDVDRVGQCNSSFRVLSSAISDWISCCDAHIVHCATLSVSHKRTIYGYACVKK